MIRNPDSDMQPWILRPYGARDREALAGLLASLPPGADAAATASAEGSGYFVAEIDGEVVGGAGFGPRAGARPEVCELKRVIVHPHWRRQGLGTALIDHCMAIALACGYRHCYAELEAASRAAILLLAGRGFSTLDRPVGADANRRADRWFLRDL